jgi:hypothetical protein
MPSRHIIDSENRIVLTTFNGTITHSDLASYYDRVGNDCSFDPSFSELLEFQENADIRLTYSDFKSLAELDPFSTVSKRAFVFRSEKSLFGVARMYQIMRDDNACVGIFTTTAGALSWLTSPPIMATGVKQT